MTPVPADPVATSEDGIERLQRLSGFLPLLEAWSAPEDGIGLRAADRETLGLALLAARQTQDLDVALPSGATLLPVLAAVLLAADPLIDPTSALARGPIALVTRRALRRQQVRELRVDGVDFETLEPRRLRGDGYTSRLSGSGIAQASLRNRLLVVNPLAGLVNPVGVDRVGCVVVDGSEERSDSLVETAKEWAASLQAPALSFVPLGESESDWTVDWGYIATHGEGRPAQLGQGLVRGATAHVVRDHRVDGLFEARSILKRLQTDSNYTGPWPPILRSASRLARQLLALPVPLDLYDGLIDDPLTVPLFERKLELEHATARRDLPNDLSLFAEVDWARLRAELLRAMTALEEQNRKALAIGELAEDAVMSGSPIDVLCASRAEARALQAYLLRGGWGVPPTAFGEVVRVRAINDSYPWSEQPRRTLLAGIPSYRSRLRLLGGDIGPLEVVSYPLEARGLPGWLNRLVNYGTEDAEQRRRATIAWVTGATTKGRQVGEVQVAVTARELDIPGALERASGLALPTKAEEAALAGADVFGWIEGEDEEREPTQNERTVIAHAFLCEPGPSVLLLPDGEVDRVIDGRVVTCNVEDLAPGMTLVVFPQEDRRPLFRRLFSYLEDLRGQGTRVWLWAWQDALRAALAGAGSPRGLADEIVRRGGDISPEAVSEWPSPYRIGPQHPLHVRLVGEIAQHNVVAAEAARIARVMQGVRQLHQQVGTAIARCVKTSIAGDTTSLDELERYLPEEAVELVANAVEGMTVVQIIQRLGQGTTSSAWLSRHLSPKDATAVYQADQ